MDEMNTALLAKQAWRIIQEPQSIWSSTLKGVYFPNSDLWAAKTQRGCSWVWKSMLQGRELLKKGGRWAIGLGEGIFLTEDNWLVNGQREGLNQNSNITMVSEIIDESHNWDMLALRSHLSPSSAISALQTPISWTDPTNTILALY